jgi:cyclase
LSMLFTRVIPRLDIKGENLVKGIHLEGLRVIGKPEDRAILYDSQGADELIIIDTVASLYGRENLINVIKRIASDVFIPITAGGGIRSIDDVYSLLDVGVDKVSINTAAVENPRFIEKVAKIIGSQSVVLSMEVAKCVERTWRIYTNNGREPTNHVAVEWAKKMVDYGAGEILLTSIDRDGTQKGFDLDLIAQVSQAVLVPVIASGGSGTPEHVIEVLEKTGCHAVAPASLFHYNICTIEELKRVMKSKGLNPRL